MRVELIAEIASNHGGSIPLAKEFIWRFTEAGADWIKFQTTRVKHLRRDDPQYAWFQQAELSDEAHHELKAECARAGVKFLTTVYHPDEVALVRGLCDTVKIGSGEAAEVRLAQAVMAASFTRVFISCGIVAGPRVPPVYNGFGQPPVMISMLRSVSRYPAPSHAARWTYGQRACCEDIDDRSYYNGWSDHCVGLEGCQVAIVDGASIIEKHVCLPQQARPVRPWEATVDEFKALRAFADEDPQRFIGRWQAA